MKTVNLHFAKTHLSRLVEEAVAGDEVVIAKAGKPLVRLVPVGAPVAQRVLGALAGRVTERADAWEQDGEIESLFYDAPVEPRRSPRVAERPRKRKS